MKARAALGLLVVLLGISTVLGLSIASRYWDRDLVDLRQGRADALLIHVEIDGVVPCSKNLCGDVSEALVYLLPAALEIIVDESSNILTSIGSDQPVCELAIQWTGNQCVYTYASESPSEVSQVSLPIYRDFQEKEQGFRLTSIGWFLSFAGDSVTSALLTARMVPWTASDDARPLSADATHFFDEGRVEINVTRDTGIDRVEVQLETPGPNAVAESIPDLLEGLSLCIRAHLRTFSEEELADAFEIPGQSDDWLHSLALYVLRPCKIRGRILEECAMEHVAFANGQRVGSSLGSTGTVPLGTGHLCYTIFGL